jgi:hypothetical protein
MEGEEQGGGSGALFMSLQAMMEAETKGEGRIVFRGCCDTQPSPADCAVGGVEIAANVDHIYTMVLGLFIGCKLLQHTIDTFRERGSRMIGLWP